MDNFNAERERKRGVRNLSNNSNRPLKSAEKSVWDVWYVLKFGLTEKCQAIYLLFYN